MLLSNNIFPGFSNYTSGDQHPPNAGDIFLFLLTSCPFLLLKIKTRNGIPAYGFELFFRHNRHVMNIYMATEAFRIFAMNCLTVRFPMTVGTLRDKAVSLLVAGYT